MSGPFAGKKIVLGVTGSIAAYKACDIASKLVQEGAQVNAVLTESAKELASTAAFEAITGNPCVSGLFEPLPTREIEHITLAREADLFLIAPATANIIAKAAHGIADDWLSTALLATEAPVLFAPAMNMHMYEHPATQENIAALKARSEASAGGAGRCYFTGPGEGALACGDVGPGRLIETEAILEAADIAMAGPKDFAGKRVLLSSGPNHEPIDPVRFLGSRSSGKMGYALAREALRRGAHVTVVTGPAAVRPPHGVVTVEVETGREMFDAIDRLFNDSDLFISAAAVADYRAANPSTTKHKRGGENLSIKLEPNPDIAAHAGANKRHNQRVVGFAAETDHVLENAAAKLEEKGLDFIVANPVGGEGNSIGADTVQATFLFPGGASKAFPTLTKAELAIAIFDAITKLGKE